MGIELQALSPESDLEDGQYENRGFSCKGHTAGVID